MSEVIEAKVTGLEELQRKLNDLPQRQGKSVLRKALRAGAAEFVAAVQREAPRLTGFLAAHFKIRTSIRGKNIAGAAYVVPDGKMKYPQTSVPGKKQRSRDVAEVARFAEFGTVHEKANPFMTRAFESAKASALDRVIQVLRELLNPSA